MILVPIIVSLGLCIVVFFFHGSGTLNRLQDLYDDDNGLLNAQTILHNYQRQIMTYDPVEELFESSTESSTQMQASPSSWDEDDWEDEDEWEEEEPVEGERGELRRALGLPQKWSVARTKLQEQESLLRTHTVL